jgi:hypothetical protein
MGRGVRLMPADDRALIRHFLAALAYRTQKAIRGAPAAYWDYSAGNQVRTPREILGHMTSLMGYTTTLFQGGSYPFRPGQLESVDAEVARFHEMVGRVADHVDNDDLPADLTLERLLQGPLADAMTHVGQLAMLRRMEGTPIPPENFLRADVDADRLGRDQAPPVAPDDEWPERI